MQKIIFTDITGLVSEDYYPKPSKMALPEWLKRLQPHYENNGHTERTGKKCIPMLDASMAGYTIFLTEEIMVKQTEFDPVFYWPGGLGIEFHAPEQLATYQKVAAGIPKWMNPWAIKTPLGCSCLFTSPLNNDSLPLTVFKGVVDTDAHVSVVNFPFRLTDSKFEGTIPAGTPIAQVFPFKRENWKIEVKTGNTEEIKRSENRINSVFANGYRNFFWSKKSYS